MIDKLEHTETMKVFEKRGDAAILVTCEHASVTLPEGYAWPEADRRLVDTHWASDLGARALALALATRLDAIAIMGGFSRLLIDPNRPEDSDTLFRATADGEPVALNHGITSAERAHRIERFLRPYHESVDRYVAAARAATLLSMHTFTPVYEGTPRSLEIGVLYDRDEALAGELAQRLGDAGYRTALNEPYSGKEGLMYSVDRHARAHGRSAVELEVRQDLAVDPDFRARLVEVLTAHFAPA